MKYLLLSTSISVCLFELICCKPTDYELKNLRTTDPLLSLSDVSVTVMVWNRDNFSCIKNLVSYNIATPLLYFCLGWLIFTTKTNNQYMDGWHPQKKETYRKCVLWFYWVGQLWLFSKVTILIDHLDGGPLCLSFLEASYPTLNQCVNGWYTHKRGTYKKRVSLWWYLVTKKVSVTKRC